MNRKIILTALVLSALGAPLLAGAPPELKRYFEGGERPLTIGPTPAGLTDTSPETCGQCHAEIVAEWRGSLHAQAWTNEVFQAAYRLEPEAFCRNCHAPPNGGTAPAGQVARDGVSCAVCHVRAGTIVGAGRSDGAPHGVYKLREMATGNFCATCHQFGFLAREEGGHGRAEVDEPQQDTVGEWRRSSRSKMACQSCHMPIVQGAGGKRHRSHAFPGGRDLKMLRSAVSVEVNAERSGDEIVVKAVVTPRGTGHAFPTGDLFRRAELIVEVEGAPQNKAVIAYARRFRDFRETHPKLGRITVRREVGDTRVAPPGTGPALVRTAHLKAPPGARLKWRFDYLLMHTPLAASSGIGEPINRTRMFEGVITPKERE